MRLELRSTVVIAVLGTFLSQVACPSSFGQSSLNKETASHESGTSSQPLDHCHQAAKTSDKDRQNGARYNFEPGTIESIMHRAQIRKVSENQNLSDAEGDDEFARLPRNSTDAWGNRSKSGTFFPTSTRGKETTKPHPCNLPANVRSLVEHCNDVGDFGQPFRLSPDIRNGCKNPVQVIWGRPPAVKQLSPSN